MFPAGTGRRYRCWTDARENVSQVLPLRAPPFIIVSPRKWLLSQSRVGYTGLKRGRSPRSKASLASTFLINAYGSRRKPKTFGVRMFATARRMGVSVVCSARYRCISKVVSRDEAKLEQNEIPMENTDTKRENLTVELGVPVALLVYGEHKRTKHGSSSGCLGK